MSARVTSMGAVQVDRAKEKAYSVFWYWRHSAFTWPWFRGWVLMFGGFIWIGAAFNVIRIGSTLGDWALALVSSSVLLAVGSFKVIAGPLLATLMRQRHWPSSIEKFAVVTSVLAGTALCAGAQRLWLMFAGKYVFPRQVAAGWMGTQTLTHEKPISVIVYAIIGMAIFHFILSGGIALPAYFREQRRSSQARQQREIRKLRLEKQETDLQLAILQAQIEPHFLFNTLASVRSLVTQDQERAAAMIDGLAHYLRVTLPKLRTTDSTSTLGEQLDICTSYLELMRLRMGERFSFAVNVPTSLRELAVPPLLLLPLVENAVTHGVEPKPDASSIHISVRQEQSATGSLLRLEVQDNGMGLGTGLIGKEVGKGVGLANIRSQLNLRYGTQASLEVSSRAGDGTSAVLVIPS